MAPTMLHAKVTLPKVTGITADSCVNDFSFHVADYPSSADLDKIVLACTDFYLTDLSPFSAPALASFLAPRLDRGANACKVDIYDVTANLFATPASAGGTLAGSPIRSGAFTLSAAAGTENVPEEVSLIARLRHLPVAGGAFPVEGVGGSRPRARNTGRVYVGPFGSNALSTVASDARPNDTLRLSMLGAAWGMWHRLLGSSIYWAVWSRKTGSMLSVDKVEVDNAWDTQRRRGIAPTDTYSVTPPTV